MPWTQERIEQLKKLWDDKFSCSQIAKILGGISRNAVIGKVNRLKLPRRIVKKFYRGPQKSCGNHVAGKIKRAGHKFKVIGPAGLPLVPFTERNAPVVPLHIQFDDLKPQHCRYPYGERPYTFCGHQVQADSSYCSEHHRLTHTTTRNISDDSRRLMGIAGRLNFSRQTATTGKIASLSEWDAA